MNWLKLLSATLAIGLLCTSCVQKEELKETAIVQAIGIDVGEKQNFCVTLQTYSPQSGGAGATIDITQNNAGILSGEGDTIAEAMQNSVISGGKELFVGYNRLLVLGHALAEQGIEPIFSYFDRNIDTRQNVEVMLAENTAKEIVTTDITQGILSAQTIEKMLEQRNQSGYLTYLPYYRLSKQMYLYEGSAVMPLIGLLPPQEEEGIQTLEKVDATQSAVFQDYHLVEELSPAETRGSVLLHNQLERTAVVTTDWQDVQATVHLYQCRCKLDVEFEEEQVILIAKVSAKGTLDEVLSHQVSNTEEGFTSWEKGCEVVLSKEMQESFDKMVNQGGADVLYLSERIRQADLMRWEAFQQSEEEWLKEVKLRTEVDVSINRVGMQTNPTQQ